VGFWLDVGENVRLASASGRCDGRQIDYCNGSADSNPEDKESVGLGSAMSIAAGQVQRWINKIEDNLSTGFDR